MRPYESCIPTQTNIQTKQNTTIPCYHPQEECTYYFLFFSLQANNLHVDIIYKPMIYYCTTKNSFVWLLLVYGFKGILLIFGLFLAWETRNVKIAALNDSHHIGRSPSNHEQSILVPIALFASLNWRGLGTRNKRLWRQRISSPRFWDFRSSCMQS